MNVMKYGSFNNGLDEAERVWVEVRLTARLYLAEISLKGSSEFSTFIRKPFNESTHVLLTGLIGAIFRVVLTYSQPIQKALHLPCFPLKLGRLGFNIWHMQWPLLLNFPLEALDSLDQVPRSYHWTQTRECPMCPIR